LISSVTEQAGSAVGLDARRIRADLQRFKEQIEAQGAETGAWRDEIEGGRKKVTPSPQTS